MNSSTAPEGRVDNFDADEIVTKFNGAAAGRSPQALALWAKSGDETGWLNLPQHLVDTACVAAHLWQDWVSPQVKATLCRFLGVNEGEAGIVVVALAGWHDVGKATLTFQRQLEKRADGAAFVDRIADSGLELKKNLIEVRMQKFPHGIASGALLRGWLADADMDGDIAASLAAVVDAHHGRPSASRLVATAIPAVQLYSSRWKAVHAELFEMVADATGVKAVLPRLQELYAPGIQLLTGLVIMADWIASNSEAFPMVVDTDQHDRVRHGLEITALTEPWALERASTSDPDDFYRQEFDWPDNYTARPVQVACLRAAEQMESPCLIIVEAPTGNGKTEAALAAARIIAKRDGAQGIVFAAPTMSTANGLFDRVTEWAERATPQAHVTSMYLAHSKGALNGDFHRLRVRQIGGSDEAEHGTIVATDWLSGRKRGLLSNFVVATVDQVLMLALQKRHSMLRHLGLAGKVVVIDECHSYDVYMSEYLHTALQWLARYGVSTILLSATLPLAQKNKLASAYTGELLGGGRELSSTAYPLISTVSTAGVTEEAVELGPTEAHIQLTLIEDSVAAVTTALSELMDEGGCALIVCNTVSRAQETYRALAQQYPGKVELHHAAFVASERATKEDALRDALGPRSRRGDGRPDLKIVVATQVAEQSLDIDADLLITDIAPMDLLIQRMGRLHRHARPDSNRPAKLRTPRTLIRAVVERDPVPEFDPGTAYIYDLPLLMSTLAEIERTYLSSGFRRPDDIAPAVHAAYAPTPNVPERWEPAYAEAKKESDADRLNASRRSKDFRIPEPSRAENLYGLFARLDKDISGPASEESGSAQVRDSVPTIEVIPIIATDYGYRAWGTPESEAVFDGTELNYKQALRLANSTVRLPTVMSKQDWIFNRVIEQLELDTPVGWQRHYLTKGQVALRLDEDGEGEVAGFRLRYSSEVGLENTNEYVQRDRSDVGVER